MVECKARSRGDKGGRSRVADQAFFGREEKQKNGGSALALFLLRPAHETQDY
jgi:hypothetical protein